MNGGRVLGVDACKRGWIAIAVEGAVTGAYFAEDIAALMARAQADGPLAIVAIDMPIGLPDREHRQADVLARAAIGPLWPSVFMTPVRQALLAADHGTASAISRQLTGHGISIQAFGLKPKLFEVEQWVRKAAMRVVEIHPEVCFARLAGAPLTFRKSSWAGAERRRAFLPRRASAWPGISTGPAPTPGSTTSWTQARLPGQRGRSCAAMPVSSLTHPKRSAMAGHPPSGHKQLHRGRTGRSRRWTALDGLARRDGRPALR